MAEFRVTAPRDMSVMGAVYGAPAWQESAMAMAPQVSPFPDAPPSRQDAAFDKSIDRWKQLAKDVFFAPAHALKEFNEKPTFMNSLGIMPMGTFAGPLAKTANKAALERAREMATGGFDADVGKYVMPASREHIWDKTGWFQGPDQKWRFEIPDNKAQLNPNKYGQGLPEIGKPGMTAGEMWHPELFTAYPELRNSKMRIEQGGDTGRYFTGGGPDALPVIQVEASSPAMARSVGLHELQHGVQANEGFAPGGNPQQMPKEMIAQERQRIGSIPENGWSSVAPAGDMSDQAIAQSLYHRLAGEVEARTVQNRMDLTPAQRRARYPWLDYDVPVEQQIVK